ncbi:hypothetical protein EDF56_104333 [Novosphingobium sp. PhB165]|uniref:hypothetical protein n=1 Tax=Novosphingobium sp. PhB165 TaxID=2485105 RepID=UPI00105390C2|nr:hypothetical protein [Novosphingobium sp. PhB165]TCM18799.1 hypothetical protein EDF56_104333 [Novosphingobium sp. PhB165]
MRMPSKTCLFGAAALTLLGAGVAEAATAKLHTMNVNAPDGSVVQVQYSGDVAPKVEVVPADAVQAAQMPVMVDPFAQMERISAMMDARMNAMMQQAASMQAHAAQMQQQAVANGTAQQGVPGFTMVGDMPKGAYVTYYSSTTDAKGCTRSVSYSSDGSGTEPKMTQAASDSCEAVTPSNKAIPAKAEKPVEQPKQALPGQTI